MKNVVLLMLVLFSFVSSAQRQVCGTIYDKSMEDRLIENKKAFFDIENRSEDWIYVPIHFHIVTKTDGSGAIDQYKILDELSHMNKNYESLKMKFYLSEDFTFINSDDLYTKPGSIIGEAQIDKFRKLHKHAVNVFIVSDIPNNNGSIGRVLGYYTPRFDVLVVRKSQFGNKSKTLSHELGHYFSLAHPFNGWEGDPYDASKHGNPLTIKKIRYGNKDYVIEFMDKSNCNIAADLICDTPPDYNFGITDDGDCKLNGPILDYHKDTIVTMEYNYMSYFFGCGSYIFTPMQGSAMKADVKSAKRKPIRSDYIPDTTLLDNLNGVIVEPANNSSTQFYDNVTLDWEDVPNANDYLVRVALKSQATKGVFYHVEGKSELVLTDLIKNRSYKWYVRAYNDGNTSGKAFGGYTFKTSGWTSGISDVKNSEELTIYPNPIQNNKVSIKSNKALGNVGISVYDMEGRIVEVLKTELKKGITKLNLTHSNYQKGFYNIIIETKDKQYIRKVLIEK